MADNCASEGDIYNVVNSGNGAGVPTEMHEQVYSNTKRLQINAALEQAERERIAAEFENLGNGEGAAPIAEPTAGEARQVNAVAKRITRELEEAAQRGVGVKAQEYAEMEHLFNGTSQASQTWWSNLTNIIAGKFVNARQDINTWFDTYFRLPGQQFQSELVRIWNNTDALIRGQALTFDQRKTALHKAMKPVANRLGLNTDELWRDVADWRMYRHTPERNAETLRRWQQDYNRLSRRMEAGENLKQHEKEALAQLPKMIDALEENLDEILPEGRRITTGTGYTNAEAAAGVRKLLAQGRMSEQEFDEFARMLGKEYDFVTQELAEKGLVTPVEIAGFPDFEWYTPAYTVRQNKYGAMNDAKKYLPMARNAFEGRSERPQNAWITLDVMHNRASSEIGMQPFATALAVANKVSRANGIDTGLVSYNQATLMRMARRGNLETQQYALGVLNQSGIVTDVPVIDKFGNRTTERRFFTFKPQWSDGHLTGMQLNQAIAGPTKLNTGFSLMAAGNSLYGQTFVRFQPFFALVGGLRDFSERSMHLFNRTYQTADGRVISGKSLFGNYVQNMPRAVRGMIEANMGRNQDSALRALYDEFTRSGANQKFLSQFDTAGRKSFTEMRDDLVKSLRGQYLNSAANFLEEIGKTKNLDGLNKLLRQSGEIGRLALQVLDKWNDTFQNSAAFSHFITLREAGLDVRRAAEGVTEIMNMTQQGSLAKYLSILSPFVRPTMQGAAAYMRTMGFTARNFKDIPKAGMKGWATTAAAGLAFGALYSMAHDAMGEDDAGMSRMDIIPASRLTNFIPIAIGNDGSYFKLPLGFGPVRLAAAMSICMDRMNRGIMSPSEAGFELLFAAGRDMAPSNAPGFSFGKEPAKYIMNLITPSFLKGALESATNTNYYGGRIYNDYNPDKALADQGRKSTPPVWHKLAQYAKKEWGFDAAPEQFQHFAKGVMLGPFRVLANAIINPMEIDAVRKGWNRPTALEEMGSPLAIMGGTLFYGKQRSPTEAYYYQAREKLDERLKRTGVNISKAQKDPAKIMERAEKLTEAGFTDEEIQDIELMISADSALRQLGKAFNQKHERWYDEEDSVELRTDFEQLDNDQLEIYKQFITQSNYYANLR